MSYIIERKQIITLNDIKNNQTFIFKDVLEDSQDKEMVVCKVNVFEFIKGDLIPYLTTTNKTILIKPIPLISNATITKEGNLTILTFTYIYDQIYRYKTIPMSNVGFDYFVTLTSNTYQGLYYFDSEFTIFIFNINIFHLHSLNINYNHFLQIINQ